MTLTACAYDRPPESADVIVSLAEICPAAVTTASETRPCLPPLLNNVPPCGHFASRCNTRSGVEVLVHFLFLLPGFGERFVAVGQPEQGGYGRNTSGSPCHLAKLCCSGSQFVRRAVRTQVVLSQIALLSRWRLQKTTLGCRKRPPGCSKVNSKLTSQCTGAPRMM